MDPLSIPTDNFYKFCAFAGIVITFFSFYLPGSLAVKIDEELYRLHLESETNLVELKFLEEDITSLEKTIKNIKENKTSKQIIAEGKVPVEISDEEIIESQKSIRNKFKETKIKSVQAEITMHRLERLNRYLLFIGILGVMGIICGLSLARYGFTKWYYEFVSGGK